MSEYKIITDSTCDLPLEWYSDHSVEMVPLEFVINDKTYFDYCEDLSSHDFYEAVRGGAMPTTNMVNISRYVEVFEKYLKEGIDVFHLSFSSGLSGSYQSACAAAMELRQIYPERKIMVCDSCCASMGHGLLLYYVVKHRDEGFSIEELFDWTEEGKYHINHLFTVDNLMHLYRGGRVKRSSAVLGTILGIKPLLDVNYDGHLISRDKIRGRKASIARLAEWRKECTKLKKFDMVMISHGDAPEDAELLKSLVSKNFEVDQFLIHSIGPVIGSHSGPATLALFFWGENRHQ